MKNWELVGKIRNAIGREAKPDSYVLDMIGDDLELTDVNGRTPIFHAVLSKRNELLATLIVRGASVCHGDSEGRTPLHFAIQERNIEAAKSLLEAGALVDAKDRHGNSPLWGAVMQFQGFEQIIKLLISFGASPDSKNLYGKSPRELALSQKSSEAAKWLDC